jgi:predicted Na+-dependent transporter
MDTLLLNRFWLLLAAVGGAVLPVAMTTVASRGRAVMQVVCGTLIAIFVAPAVQRHFLPDAVIEIQAGVSFLVGCFGLKLTSIVQHVLDRHGEGVADRLIGRVTGDGK